MKINLQLPAGISYPTIAVIPFAQGAVTKQQLQHDWQLFADGHPVYCYREIVALWPDRSIKWAHIHSVFTGDKCYSFEITKLKPTGPQPSVAPDALDWEIQVEDDQGNIWRNTASDRALLKTISMDQYGLGLYDKYGGWEHPSGGNETRFVELHENMINVTWYEGWLKQDGIKSIYRYRTCVTSYPNNFFKISQSVIISGSMKGKKIKHISFLLNDAQPVPFDNIFGIDGSRYHYTLSEIDGSVLVHQRRTGLCEVTRPGHKRESHFRSDGYVHRHNISLMVRDLWEKFPQALESDPSGIAYRQWYGKSPVFDGLAGGVKERLLDKNIHKMQHLLHDTLANDVPKTNDPNNPEWADKFYEPLSALAMDRNGNPILDGNGNYQRLDTDEGGYTEEFIEYTDYAEMEGITFHDDIAVCLNSIELPTMATAWNNNPVGSCDPTYIEHTGVADFGAKRNDFANIETFLEDSALGYFNPDRFEYYGRFLYGDCHRNTFPNPQVDRPSRHRAFYAGYYGLGETLQLMRLRGGSEELIKLARRTVEHYLSIVMISYNAEFRTDGHPLVFANVPAGSKYRMLWWRNTYPDLQAPHPWPQEWVSGHGDWCQRIGRVPDPDALWWSWVLDGSRYCREGYEKWYSFVRKGVRVGAVNTSNAAREGNKTLVYTIHAYDYFKDHPVENFRVTLGYGDMGLDKHILDIGEHLLQTPLRDVKAGPLWHPRWISTYVHFLIDNYTAADKTAMVSKALNYCITNYNSNFYQGQKTLDMAALLMDIILNKFSTYPTLPVTMDTVKINDQLDWIAKTSEKIYKGLETKWMNFGVGVGEFGDAWLKLQWGAFVKRLRLLGLATPRLREYDFYGHYPCSVYFNGGSQHAPLNSARSLGNEYWILQPTAQPLGLNFRFNPSLMNTGGGFTFSEIWTITPSMITTRFTSVIKKKDDTTPDITADHYPSGNTFINLNDYTIAQRPADFAFETFAPPYNIGTSQYGWQHADLYFTRPGEEYTVQDSIDKEETGIYRVYINGLSVYPGIAADGLHEAMLLTNYDTQGNNDSAGDYMFTDSKFYLKNLETFPLTITLWASVLVAVTESTPKITHGSFARVKKMDPAAPSNTLESYDLSYNGSGYGDLSTRVSFIIPAGEVMVLKTILIYNSTLVRAKLNGRLLCARSMDDIDAFS